MNHDKIITRLLLALGSVAVLLFLRWFGGPLASAATQSAPLAFAISSVDTATGLPTNTFYLGQSISINFKVTNLSAATVTIPDLGQTEIPVHITGSLHGLGDAFVRDRISGGTISAAADSKGMITWFAVPRRSTTLGPGQSVTVAIDLGGFLAQHIDDGSYTFSGTYNGTLQSQASFSVVIDQTKSIPVLEQLAAGQDDGDKRWAQSYLDTIRKPSIGGRIADSVGQPVSGVTITAIGPEHGIIDTSADGTYNLTQLASGGSYTLTPDLDGYTFEPVAQNVSNLTTKLTGVNFIATRVITGVNVASEDMGAVAVASSTFSVDDYPAASVIDGINTGSGWGLGSGGWLDGTPGVFPDWVEVDFPNTQTIDWINVFTLPDNYKTPVEPTLNQTFTLYGITDYDVQYWNGTTWATVPGGSVNGNNNVWRKFTFPTISTTKIRVFVRNGLGGQSRITEIEAFHANVH